MASDESRRIAVTVLALGGLTLLPILVRLSRLGGEPREKKLKIPHYDVRSRRNRKGVSRKAI